MTECAPQCSVPHIEEAKVKAFLMKEMAREKGKRDRKKNYIIKEEPGASSIGTQAMDGSTWHQGG